MPPLKIKFDSTLQYQAEAIDAVVDLFSGLPAAPSLFSMSSRAANQLAVTEMGVPNPIPADLQSFAETVRENLRAVQERHLLSPGESPGGMDFSVEMETGTGKTYVYLRTIFELNKRYGFTKFVIVVPSVAIREGVLASIDLLREHLTSMYTQPFDAAVYDSKQLGRVRQFAQANTIQLLVMNIQAFQKDTQEAADLAKANIINREQDRMSGYRPIEFIQRTHPVVIIDEPQNMESATARAAIARLHPFCTLRYSATHKNPYNRVFRLGPIEAYDLNLVKQIEVASVVPDADFHSAFVRLLQVDPAKNRAQIEFHAGAGTAGRSRKAWVKRGSDLSVLSAGRQEYADGWIVDDIHFRPGAEAVDFSNGREVSLAEPLGAFAEDVRRKQVYETVRQHLDKEKALAPLGVKVLSLFFLDRVANYRGLDSAGRPVLGEIGRWFEEAYEELRVQPRYATLNLPAVQDVHGGYFSVDKKGFKDTRGTGEADSATYDLIMRDKQKLLSVDEPLRFLFSHSALREGWDNPNVFQICTLNESKSADRKRQEIGRGLRLPVNQAGERLHDPAVNRLTIIANESYRQFAATLQKEYEEDTGQRFGIVPRTAFAALPDPVDGDLQLGKERSFELWTHLRDTGYIDGDGAVLDKFWPEDPSFELELPEHFLPIRPDVVDALTAFLFRDRVRDSGTRVQVRFRKQVTLHPDFQQLWDRISRRTRYRVQLDSEQLISQACASIAAAPAIDAPKVRVRTVEIEHSVAGLRTDRVIDQRDYDTAAPAVLPDILADLQNETDLTRRTLVRILTGCGRLGDFLVNPQAFLSLVTATINGLLRDQLVDGLTYEPVPGLAWEMRRLEPAAGQEIQRYAQRVQKIDNLDKCPFDHVEIDSAVERRFARALDANRSVKLFMKLPSWFTVDTPVGTYNPDWALVMEHTDRVYLVRETKSSLVEAERRPVENQKISCARKHFAAINVDYDDVRDLDDVFAGLAAGSRQGASYGV